MNTFSFHLKTLNIVLLVVLLFSVADASGQATQSSSRRTDGRSNTETTRTLRASQEEQPADVEANEKPISPEAKIAVEQMIALREELKSNRQETDRMFREMPIAFTPRQQQQQQEIDVLLAQRTELEHALIAKGIEVFKLVPLQEVFSTRIVLGQLTESLAPQNPESRFNPSLALELSNVLIKEENIPWQVLMQTFKACYATHNFELAAEVLDKLEAFGPVKNVYYEVLEETSNAWQEELAIRRQESLTGDLPYAVVETTEGTFQIELFENQAPVTVYDFVSRAESGFYDNQPFFMVKSGKFARVGWNKETGQPANDAITSEAQRDTARKHFAGSVSMVSFDGQTTNSVFQISHQPNFELNGQHTVFGRVVDFESVVDGETIVEDAMDVVFQLNPFDGSLFSPRIPEASKIIKVTIGNKRAHDYKSTATTAAPRNDALKSMDNPPAQGAQTSSFDLLPQGSRRN